MKKGQCYWSNCPELSSNYLGYMARDEELTELSGSETYEWYHFFLSFVLYFLPFCFYKGVLINRILAFILHFQVPL